jgi:hypothetical protein
MNTYKTWHLTLFKFKCSAPISLINKSLNKCLTYTLINPPHFISMGRWEKGSSPYPNSASWIQEPTNFQTFVLLAGVHKMCINHGILVAARRKCSTAIDCDNKNNIEASIKLIDEGRESWLCDNPMKCNSRARFNCEETACIYIDCFIIGQASFPLFHFNC